MNTRKLKRFFNPKMIIGIFLLLIALLVLLIPVKTAFSDPCGSAIFQTRVTFVLDGEVKDEVTPPCNEAHKKRMLWGIPSGVLGLGFIAFSALYGKKDEENKLT